METTERLRTNLRRLEVEIAEAAGRVGRSAESIQLLVVTKYVDAGIMRQLHRLGIRDFGESRVQSAAAKRTALEDLEDARFHLIGHLQRNKVRRALEMFASVHSLDSLRLARELESSLAATDRPAPELYVELNVAGEDQKTGLSPKDLLALLETLATCPHLAPALRGLMCMPPYSGDPEASRPHFRKLRELRDAMRDRGLLPENAGLSMGMSSDFQVAVEEGATVVRVGSRVFGD